MIRNWGNLASLNLMHGQRQFGQIDMIDCRPQILKEYMALILDFTEEFLLDNKISRMVDIQSRRLTKLVLAMQGHI